MATRAGTLYVDLVANTKQFISELDKSRTKATAFGVAIGKIFADLTQATAQFGVSAVKALPDLTKAAIDLADNLGKLSQKTGVSVETLSRMRLAAESSDTSLDQLGQGMRNLSNLMVDAQRGNKAAAETFRRLGIEVTDSSGRLRPMREVLLASADAIAGLGDGAEKTSAAVDLFGARIGQDLIPFLNQGADGISKMEAQSDRLGLTISTTVAKAAERFNDTLKAIKESTMAVGLAVAEAALPALNDLATGFQKFAEIAALDLDKLFLARELGTTVQRLDEIPEFLNEIDQAAKTAGVDLQLLVDTPRAAALNMLRFRDEVAAFREDLRKAGAPVLAPELTPESLAAQNKALIDRIKSRTLPPITIPLGVDLEPLPGFFEFLAAERQQRFDAYQTRLGLLQETNDWALTVAESMQTGFQAELFEGAAEAAKIVPPEIEKISESAVRLDREFSTALTNMAQGIGEAVINARGLGDVFEQASKRIQSAIIGTVIEGALAPLIAKLREAASIGLGGGGGFLTRLLGLFGAAIAAPFTGGASLALAAPAYSGLGSATFGNFLAGLPGLASGGPVEAGRPYLVGESGREMFIPDVSGRIIANGEWGGESTRTVIHIDARGAEPGVEQRILAVMRAAIPGIVQQSVGTMQEIQRRRI